MSIFHPFLKILMVLSPFQLDPDPDPYCFCLDPDPDPYQSLPWIRIRNKSFHILDPDPYQNYTDPPHCRVRFQIKIKIKIKIKWDRSKKNFHTPPYSTVIQCLPHAWYIHTILQVCKKVGSGSCAWVGCKRIRWQILKVRKSSQTVYKKKTLHTAYYQVLLEEQGQGLPGTPSGR